MTPDDQFIRDYGEDTCRIPLGYGRFAIIDAVDAAILINFRWIAHGSSSGRTWYAVSSSSSLKEKHKVLMHRVLMRPPENMDIDHKNGNGLDNRRSNLRVCDRSQNTANSRSFTPSRSGFRGVQKGKLARSWTAVITVDYRVIYLGSFPTAVAAAEAYDAAARKHHGRFAKLNFPEATDAP